jgi:cytochrome o ubiquinol oxidase subunit 3
MNIAVAVADVHHEALPSGSDAGPAPKRIVVAYGFWIFLLSDIIMFSALFAAYASLVHATAGGPTGAQLFNQGTAAIETPAFSHRAIRAD